MSGHGQHCRRSWVRLVSGERAQAWGAVIFRTSPKGRSRATGWQCGAEASVWRVHPLPLNRRAFARSSAPTWRPCQCTLSRAAGHRPWCARVHHGDECRTAVGVDPFPARHLPVSHLHWSSGGVHDRALAVWAGVLIGRRGYQPWGLMFDRQAVFAGGGGPVWYVATTSRTSWRLHRGYVGG